MSRPRKPPNPDPAVIDLSGRLICTDRGQHPATRITSFTDQQEPGEVMFAETPLWDVLAEGGTAKGITFRFRCRRCGRDVQLREQTVIAVIDAFRQAGEDRTHITVDVSLLPCLAAAFRVQVGHCRPTRSVQALSPEGRSFTSPGGLLRVMDH